MKSNNYHIETRHISLSKSSGSKNVLDLKKLSEVVNYEDISREDELGYLFITVKLLKCFSESFNIITLFSVKPHNVKDSTNLGTNLGNSNLFC